MALVMVVVGSRTLELKGWGLSLIALFPKIPTGQKSYSTTSSSTTTILWNLGGLLYVSALAVFLIPDDGNLVSFG